MIPVCLILGDSTAVGTAAALATSSLQCEARARVGASYTDALRLATKSLSANLVVIALRSNDPRNPKLLQNLAAIRLRTTALRVIWLAPYNPAVSVIVRTAVATFGDTVVYLEAFRTKDGIHPASYRPVARAIGSLRPTPRMTGDRSTRPGVRASVRQAVVVTF